MHSYIRLFRQDGMATVESEDESSVRFRFPNGKVRSVSKRDEGVEWEFVDAEGGSVMDIPAAVPAPDTSAPPMDPFHENPETDLDDEALNVEIEEDLLEEEIAEQIDEDQNDDLDDDSVVESEQPEE